MKSKLSLCLFFILIAFSVLADDHHFFRGGGGSSGPMEPEAFAIATVFFGVCFFAIGGLMLVAHSFLLASLYVVKAKLFLHYLPFVAWILLLVALLPSTICYHLLAFAYYGSDDTYGIAMMTVFFFLLGMLYFYLFFVLAGLFSDRPFGKYLVRSFLVIGVVSGAVGLLFGKGISFLLVMLLCAFACWLSYKLYNKMLARKQKKEQPELASNQ